MKILYLTTISNTVNTFLIPHIEMLINEGHCVDVGFNLEQEINSKILKMGCKIHQIPFQREPLRTDNVRAYKLLKKIIKDEKYDIIHTHTPIASALVRLVCRTNKNMNIIYTAHGFHFYKGAPLKNWIIYYPLEKWLARFTNTLITINREDYNFSKDRFKAGNVIYMPGVGLNLSKISNISVNKFEKKRSLGFKQNDFILLSVGELNLNKNHEVVIKALSQIREKNIHYIICGIGSNYEWLNQLSKKNGVEKNVHFLGFREDIIELCKVSDIFVFPSFREGLSVALMEAMATGLPVVASDIRGNKDLITNNTNGYLCNPLDSQAFREKILCIYKDESKTVHFGDNSIKEIEKFSSEKVIEQLKKVYKPFLN